MGHLKPGELVDLAEGTQPESSVPHLQTCGECRRQLAALRAMMTVTADVPVPEPSPLFWDHLSARIGAAVAVEGTPRRAFWFGRRLAFPLAAVAFAIVVAVAWIPMRGGQGKAGGKTPLAAPLDEIASSEPSAWLDEVSLDLVSDLAADVDWSTAVPLGLETHNDASDALVGQLSAGERWELQRLLKEELARSGA